ncbi:MAG: right-handed parallel beta-helix repeat-containing protein [Cytophagaceae bacterium]
MQIRYLLLFTVFYINFLQGGLAQGDCGCNHTIKPEDLYFDGNEKGVKPGDVICVMASTKRYLGFINIKGAEGNPVTIKNCGGRVVVQNTDWYYGMKFDYSSHFKLTGTGSPQYKYGFLVDGTPFQIAGLGIAKLTTDFEVEFIEVARTGFAGIIAKSDPDCTGEPNRGSFVQRNTRVHDNYIHHTLGEGIYIGFPHYRGVKKLCGADSVRLLPHDVEGVRIYNNRIEYAGREGIQVGCAVSDVEIYDNVINGYGMLDSRWQRSGIHITTGTTGKIYNNLVANGSGSGMWLNGYGDNVIYNNIFANVGNNGEDAILVEDSLVRENTGYKFINNTIIGAGKGGFKFNNNFNSSGNLFINNILVVPSGNYKILAREAGFEESNNFFASDINEVHFVNPATLDFALTDRSPAIDIGQDASVHLVNNDFYYVARPRGNNYDAGAVESEHKRDLFDFIVFPSPSEGDATAAFTVKEEQEVSLGLYDSKGALIKELLPKQTKVAGYYTYPIDGVFLRSGLYYVRLERGKKTASRKFMVIR